MVLFESMTGNTKRAAELIGGSATAAGDEVSVRSVTDIDFHELATADVVYIGTWVDGLVLFGQRPGRSGRLQKLIPVLDRKPVAVFNTYAINAGKALDKTARLLERKGALIVGKHKFRRDRLEVGVVPFGLVAGATPVTHGLGGAVAVGFSVIVFAGASQLAAIDVLGSGGSAFLAALAAWTINLRLMLYSASLAPYVAKERLRTRLWMSYVLTDQAYAVSINRWGEPAAEPRRRVPYYAGAAFLLWISWQLSTIAGVLLGNVLPDDVPLAFAVPLVFLVLLIPAINSKPAAVAAIVGGGAAVLAAELGAGNLALMVGAVSGIVAGTIADLRWPPPNLEIVTEPSG